MSVMRLPYDYPREDGVNSQSGATNQFEFALYESSGLHTLAIELDVTLHAILAAALLIMLWRLTGQVDIRLAVATSLTKVKLHSASHDFENDIVELQLRVDDKLSFIELVRQFGQISQRASGSPPTEIHDSGALVSFGPIQCEPSSAILGEAKDATRPNSLRNRDLCLGFRESKSKLDFDLCYRADRFAPSTIEYISREYISLLCDIAVDPKKNCAAYDVFVLPARAVELESCKQGASLDDRLRNSQSICDRFAVQVAAFPSHIAVETPQRTLTYRDLDRAARAVARSILRRVGPSNEPIALLFEHDALMVVALLGALFAGKAYVPLDSNYPEARLRGMLEDCDTALLLTSQRGFDHATALARGTMPILNVDTIDLTQAAGSLPTPVDGPNHLAYILYTSGSAGTPKGVMQRHRNVLYFNFHYSRNLRIAPTDKIALLSSYSFDAAVMDIFAALLNGATLCPINPRAMTPAELRMRMAKQHISIYHSTPTLYRHIFADCNTPGCESLRLIVLGGELVTPNDVAIYRRTFRNGVIFVNGYGPTESTLATQYFLTGDTTTPADSIPVGYPIAGVQIAIGDPDSQTRAFASGELFLHHEFLFPGYWNSDEMTARAFVTNRDGLRFYRTGDVAYLRVDGSLVIRGRVDEQVKIRGFRVEPGEIEAALMDEQNIQNAVVIPQAVNNEVTLVAYLAPTAEASNINPDALRGALRRRLPDYMMPARFVVLKELPVTRSGKVDRLALPSSSAHMEAQQIEDTATSTQQQVKAIWMEVLKIGEVDVAANFFDIGGHSLLAIQVVARIRSAFTVDLPLQAMFETPTIWALASRIDQLRSAQRGSALPQIERARARAHALLPMSFAQQRLWFLDQLDAAAGTAYNMSAGLRLTGELHRNALTQALNRISARHDSIRTTFVMRDDVAVQYVGSADAGFPLVERDLQAMPPEERDNALRAAIDEEAVSPFDLQAGPLARGLLLRVSQTEHVLVISMHHIISDGWSIGVFVRELRALYTAFSSNLPDPLPPLPLQYADYALWERDWLTGTTLQSHREFWIKYLHGAPHLLTVPSDRPRPSRQSYRGDSYLFCVPRELSSALREFGASRSLTLFMTLFAVWAIQLVRSSGMKDVVIGTPVANRQHAETEQLIGFFVNTVALRVRTKAEWSIGQFMSEVKQVTMAAYAHQTLPFDEVVNAIQPPRTMAYSPVFQVMLSLNNIPGDEALSLPGLTIRNAERAQKTTHYDLSLSFVDDGKQFHGTLIYATDLFGHGRIEQMARDYLDLARTIVADDSQPLRKIIGLPPQSMLEERLW
jgi:amino acid adenylation domain-containing protein